MTLCQTSRNYSEIIVGMLLDVWIFCWQNLYVHLKDKGLKGKDWRNLGAPLPFTIFSSEDW